MYTLSNTINNSVLKKESYSKYVHKVSGESRLVLRSSCYVFATGSLLGIQCEMLLQQCVNEGKILQLCTQHKWRELC